MSTPMAHHKSLSDLRLGSAEMAILSELSGSGEPMPRRALLMLVRAKISRPTHDASSASESGVEVLLQPGRARQNAESTLSRALKSLERKGLIVRSVSKSSRPSLVSAASPPPRSFRERSRREDEALAVRCDALSAELRDEARKVRKRALSVASTS